MCELKLAPSAFTYVELMEVYMSHGSTESLVQIESLYAERGIQGVRPRFAYPLIRLAHTGPLTIRELADSLDRSHSAMSQTITAMRAAGELPAGSTR